MTGSNEINKDSPNKEIMYAQIDKSIKYLMWNIFSFNDEIQTQMSSSRYKPKLMFQFQTLPSACHLFS